MRHQAREEAPSATTAPPARVRRGVRITLLSLAAAILLLGAAAACAFGYLTISRGLTGL